MRSALPLISTTRVLSPPSSGKVNGPPEITFEMAADDLAALVSFELEHPFGNTRRDE
jgi:hypothetical protein